jgi:hypothetical protein
MKLFDMRDTRNDQALEAAGSATQPLDPAGQSSLIAIVHHPSRISHPVSYI